MKSITLKQNSKMQRIISTAFLVAAILISNIPAANAQNNCKDLLRAVKSNNITSVKEILANQSPNCIYKGDGEPRTPLVAAARKGNLMLIKLLVEADAKVEFHANGDETPFIAASKGGHLDTVKYLYSKGAAIDLKVSDDGTALIAAVKNGHYEVAKLLLEKGANPYLRTSGDEYAMYHARNSKDEPMINLLEKFKSNN